MSQDRPRKARVLLIDDDDQFTKTLRLHLAEHYDFVSEPSGAAGLRAVETLNPDVVLLDIALGEERDGIDLIPLIHACQMPPPIIMLSETQKYRTVVRAMKQGAFDYEAKPPNIPLLKNAIERALDHQTQQRLLFCFEEERDSQLPQMIMKSEAMLRMHDLAHRAAQTDVTVLITGQSGVGKSALARLMRSWGPRKQCAFRSVSCADFNENLIEDELFSHEIGAFVGAVSRRRGLFELANGGTLFLDEISECSLTIQSKLLRVLDTGAFTRLGGEDELHTDVRIITATNRDLDRLVEEKRFRRDLNNRLRGIHICIPPLRERPDDILPIAEYFLRHYASRYRKPTHSLSPEAKAVLEQQSWPGNVWDLKSSVEAALTFCDSEVLQAADLLRVTYLKDPTNLSLPVARRQAAQETDRAYLRARLRQAQGVVKAAAALSEVTEQYFRKMIKKYKIDPNVFRDSKDE